MFQIYVRFVSRQNTIGFRLPSAAASTHRGDHRVDVDRGALSTRIGDVTRVIAVPVGATTDGAAVFHGVALSRLQLWVGEEHHQTAAAASGSRPTASATQRGTLVGTYHRAVRLEDLDGIARLRVDFQRGLGAHVGRRVARGAARANRGASRDLELVVVAVEAFLGLARTIADVETAIENEGAVRVGAIVVVAVGIIGATVDGEVLCRVDGVVFHRIGLNVAAIDGQGGLALYALAAFVLALRAMNGDVAAVDGQVATAFHALRVGVVAATPGTAAATADGDALAAGGDVECEQVVARASRAEGEGRGGVAVVAHVDALAARARTAQGEAARQNAHVAVGTQASRGVGVFGVAADGVRRAVALCGDGEGAAVDGDATVGADALAAMIAGGQGDGEVATYYINIGVTLDGRAIGRHVLVVDALKYGAARRGDVDGAARDADLPHGLDALRDVAAMGEVDAATRHVEGAVALEALAVVRRRDNGNVGVAADGDVGVARNAV